VLCEILSSTTATSVIIMK